MFQFKVVWNFDGETKTSYGLVAGNNLTEAMANVVRDFGEMNIESCELKYLYDSNCICYVEGITDLSDKFEEI